MAKLILPGSISGREMKAVAAFTHKDNAMSLFHTPFVYNGRLWATDSYRMVVIDWPQAEELDPDKVYKIPEEALEKILVGYEYAISTTAEMPEIFNIKTHGSWKLEDTTERMSKRVVQLQEMLDAEIDCGTPEHPIAIAGVNPAFVSEACDIAKAISCPTITFGYSAPKSLKTMEIMRVKFIGGTKNADVIICPKRV